MPAHKIPSQRPRIPRTQRQKRKRRTFEEEYRDDRVDEIGLELDVVHANVVQDLGEDVGDLDVGEGERLALDAQDEVLHPQRKGLVVDDELGRATPLDHEAPGAVAVKLRDGAEEVEEVAAVALVEGGDEARVDEDDLGLVPEEVHAIELGEPGGAVVRYGTKAVDDVDAVDVGGVLGGVGFGVISPVCPEGGEDALGRWLEELDHDVAWRSAECGASAASCEGVCWFERLPG